MDWRSGERYQLHILETPQQMTWVEELQRIVWPGNEAEIVPGHILSTAVHNGGLLIGAFYLPDKSPGAKEATHASLSGEMLVGFVFSFPGYLVSEAGLKLKHCSHMLGVHPKHRNAGIGFALKRAQWQMVRHHKIDWITWTYDPLLSSNAYLNIHRLGAVCNTFLPNHYGELRDGLNLGLPTNRFQVDWWLNSSRVERRLSKKPRNKLDLAHFLEAEIEIFNPTILGRDGFPHPGQASSHNTTNDTDLQRMFLVEIPSDIQTIKKANLALAAEWQDHSQIIFSKLFSDGYLVTDFIYLPGNFPRSFYVLSYGESTL